MADAEPLGCTIAMLAALSPAHPHRRHHHHRRRHRYRRRHRHHRHRQRLRRSSFLFRLSLSASLLCLRSSSSDPKLPAAWCSRRVYYHAASRPQASSLPTMRARSLRRRQRQREGWVLSSAGLRRSSNPTKERRRSSSDARAERTETRNGPNKERRRGRTGCAVCATARREQRAGLSTSGQPQQ